MLQSMYSLRFPSYFRFSFESFNIQNALFQTIISRCFILLTFSRTKSTGVLLKTLLVSVCPLSKLGAFPLLMCVMLQVFVLHHGASQLKTADVDFYMFLIDTLFPLRIIFPFSVLFSSRFLLTFHSFVF
jgi:hypothetical protein